MKTELAYVLLLLAFANNHEFMIGDVGYSCNDFFCSFVFHFFKEYFVNFLLNFNLNFNSKTNKQRKKACAIDTKLILLHEIKRIGPVKFRYFEKATEIWSNITLL